MRVHHLNCGSMCPAFGRLLGADVGPLARGFMPAHCVLVETAQDGLVLVDTGFGTRDLAGHTPIPKAFRTLTAPTFAPRETALAQIEALGFTAKDVRHVVLTHLDVDHAGGISDFPDARIHVHAREHAAAIARPTFKERERYIAAHWDHGPRWEVYTEDGETWRGLPAVAKLRGLRADLGLVPLHGHTRGHSAIVIGDGARWLVHAGDAYFHRNTIKGDAAAPFGVRVFERAMQTDGAARRASVAALRELHRRYDDLTIFCAHDPVELAELARLPAAAA